MAIDVDSFVGNLPKNGGRWEPPDDVVAIIQKADAANREGARYTLKSIYDKLKAEHPELVRCSCRTFERFALSVVNRGRWNV